MTSATTSASLFANRINGLMLLLKLMSSRTARWSLLYRILFYRRVLKSITSRVFNGLKISRHEKLLAMQSKVKNRKFQIPAKLYRIGELVRYSPFSRQTIHNYTIMGLIREAQWTEGGHRLYDESVFKRLSKIIELKKTKTLWEIRKILNKQDATDKATRRHSHSENN